MKLKKIFAGMAASAIAMTTFAMGSAPAASADATVTGNAGITFQTDGNYTYRDITNTAGDHGVFPQLEVGCAGGANGFSSVDAKDTAINGSGTYTVSIPTSGVIDIEPDLAKPANKKAWWIDEDKGVNRMGSKWDMRGSYEPPELEDENADIPPVDQWELQAGNTCFNMLGISTDIPAYYDKENHKCYLDEAMTQEVTVSDVTVDIPGAGSFTGDAGCWKDDVDTLCISLINVYDDTGASNTIDGSAFPTDEGQITVTFTINFAEAGDDSTNSNESGTESGDSNASGSDSNASSSQSSSSKGGNGGGGNGGSKGGTTKTETTESLADSASDATENAKSGAPAGIALALAAVAGAVVVVSRKKN